MGAGEEGPRLAVVGDAAELVRHAVARHHAAGDVRDSPEIVRGTGREMLEDDEFGRAPAQKCGHLVLKLLAGHEEAVLRRPLDRVAERPDPARNDRNLVHRVEPGRASATSAWPIAW